ncbi:MAG: ATP-binding protein [Micrococcales bacterium]|nr:ATP-binding protein [Micrococcales bacterium]
MSTLAAVYGANASGKSTLVKAIDYLVGAVRDSYVRWPVDGGTQAEPFRLDRDSAGLPSSFEVEVRADDGLDYQYGFSVDSCRVVREWLYVYRTARRTELFTRDGAELRFGRPFRGPRTQLVDTARTRPNALTLAVGAQFGSDLLAPAHQAVVSIETYRASVHTDSGLPVMELRSPSARAAVDLLTEHPERKAAFLELMRNADIGVSDVSVDEPSLAEIKAWPELEASTEWLNENWPRIRRNLRQLRFTHTSASGGVDLPFESESDGTKALVSFAPIILAGLDEGRTVVIDEVDTSLHPFVVRALVGLFADPSTNPRQAQLVFTTHDTSLLGRGTSSEPLARDQVWRTEKDPVTGAAELVAVAEYSPRKDESLERGYLTGRYGGIPHIPTPLVSMDR